MESDPPFHGVKRGLSLPRFVDDVVVEDNVDSSSAAVRAAKRIALLPKAAIFVRRHKERIFAKMSVHIANCFIRK